MRESRDIWSPSSSSEEAVPESVHDGWDKEEEAQDNVHGHMDITVTAMDEDSQRLQ